MNLRDQTSFIRWGIPGWVFLAAFFLFVADDTLVNANKNLLTQLEQVFKSASDWQSLVAGLVLAGIGIPVGYLIYQLYFYVRWNSPVSTRGLFPPFILGRAAEISDTLRDIKRQQLAFGLDWRRELIANPNDHRADWHYLSIVLGEALRFLDDKGNLSARHSYLLDVLHSLGAAEVATILAFGAYSLTKWQTQTFNLTWVVFPVIFTFATIMLLSRQDNRNKNDLRMGTLLIPFPAELLLGFIVFLYFSINPAIVSSIPDVVFRYGLLWLITLALIWSGRGGRLIILLTALIATGVSYASANLLAGFVDWPFVTSTLVFEAFLLVLLKNRQNARENLVTFEYYHLKRFLESMAASATPLQEVKPFKESPSAGRQAESPITNGKPKRKRFWPFG